MSSNSEISFLLGAGFSAEAGIPVRNEINDRLKKLKWDDFMIYSEATTRFLKSPDPNAHWQNVREREFVAAIIEFYNTSIAPEFDYEEFYDYCYKIYNDFIDPKFEEFFRTYVLAKGEFLNKANYIAIVIRTIEYLVDDLLNYNIDLYNSGLIDAYLPFLNLLRRLSEEFQFVSIYTLNHDLLLERLLVSDSLYIDYCDGFEINGSKYYIKSKNQQIRVKYYSNKFDKKIRVVKLHGSIDNYVYNFSEPFEMVKIPKDLYPPDLYKETKIDESWMEENCWTLYQPNFLSGTTTKILKYDKHPFYSTQFSRLNESLSNSKLLISIGYGLQDSKINELLERELANNLKIVVVKRSKSPALFFDHQSVFHYGTGMGIADLTYENIEQYLQ